VRWSNRFASLAVKPFQLFKMLLSIQPGSGRTITTQADSSNRSPAWNLKALATNSAMRSLRKLRIGT
jgi:hypothetical protein